MDEKIKAPVVADEDKTDPREAFKKEKRRFGAAVKIAIAVSKATGGRTPAENIVMASFVFTRMCIAADTLLYVIRREIGNSKDQTLDHYSIGVIARNIIESALMFHYLSQQGMSEEDWRLIGSQSTRRNAEGSPLEGNSRRAIQKLENTDG